MNFKVLLLVLFFMIFVNFTCSWSSPVSGILRPRGILSSSWSFDPNMVESMASGSQIAIDQCKEMFKWDKWNCPESAFSSRSNKLMTKEKSYIEAIIAAGIIYEITQNCAKGHIKGCGCDLQRRGPRYKITLEELIEKTQARNKKVSDWYWGGCSEDTTYAENIVRKYFDEDEKNSDPQAFISRHNNRIGREIVRRTMVRKCRCYGVTGSCALQMCWMEMAPFKEIAANLKEKYNKAVRITFDEVQGALSIGNTARQNQFDVTPQKLSDKLFYLDSSPDYCKINSLTGWGGTEGRVCSRTRGKTVSISEKKSCRNLCRSCGHKVKRQRKTINYRCNCKFEWCYEVKCEVCSKTVDEFFCK